MSEEDEMLTLFRGLPRAYNPDRKDRFQRLQDLVERLREQHQIESPRIEHDIIRNWKQIVGPQRAHRCKPSKITRDRTLIITTTNSTLRSELTFDCRNILKRLQDFCGKEEIREVVIR